MVYVSTGPGQSTTSQVTLTVYGDAGNSGPLPLGKPNQGLFKPGQTDEFEVNIPNFIIHFKNKNISYLSLKFFTIVFDTRQ